MPESMKLSLYRCLHTSLLIPVSWNVLPRLPTALSCSAKIHCVFILLARLLSKVTHFVKGQALKACWQNTDGKLLEHTMAFSWNYFYDAPIQDAFWYNKNKPSLPFLIAIKDYFLCRISIEIPTSICIEIKFYIALVFLWKFLSWKLALRAFLLNQSNNSKSKKVAYCYTLRKF